MSVYKRLTAIFFPLIACWILVGFPQTVAANVYLERSNPAPESWLDQPPESIQLRFNQSIITDISQLWLQDEQGRKIEGEIAGEEDNLTLKLPPLVEGVYEVHWSVISFDANVTGGSFQFYIGENDLSGTVYYYNDWMLRNQTDAERTTDWGKTLRILELMAVLLLSGWMMFRMFLWTEEGDHLAGDTSRRATVWERYLIICTTVVLLLTGIGQVVQRSMSLTQTSWQDSVLWETVGFMFSSTLLGIVVGIRIILTGLLILLSYGKKSRSMLKLLLLLGLIFSFSLVSHAYNSPVLLPQAVHLFTVAFWFGGLLGFTIYSFFMKDDWESLTYLHQRLKHFSTLTLYVLIITMISGFLLTMIYVGSWDSMISTDYGRTLLWKMVLIAPILLIAAWHRWVWWPVLQQTYTQQAGRTAIRALMWGIRLELVLAMGVIIFAGMMSQMDPPGEFHLGHQHDSLNIHLQVRDEEEPGGTLARAYVLKDSKRLENASVTFHIWDKEYEGLFMNVEDYCRDNNMNITMYIEAFVERGFIREVEGIEDDTHVYVANIELEPGQWNIGVRVEHENENLVEYRDFNVEIEG